MTESASGSPFATGCRGLRPGTGGSLNPFIPLSGDELGLLLAVAAAALSRDLLLRQVLVDPRLELALEPP